MRVSIAAIAVMAVLAGFASSSATAVPRTAGRGDSLQNVGSGWLAGSVRRGPIVPVCREGVPCYGPAVGVGVVVTQGQRTVARVVTNRFGRFQVRLLAGAYVVGVRARFPVGGSELRRVRVRRGLVTSVRLFIDTGIR